MPAKIVTCDPMPAHSFGPGRWLRSLSNKFDLGRFGLVVDRRRVNPSSSICIVVYKVYTVMA
jgi:hypothetical protein